MKLNLIIGVLFFFSINQQAFSAALNELQCRDQHLVYTVKKNDSLSIIIRDLKMRPIYGPNGHVKSLAIKNSLENQDRIYIGQVLELEKSCDGSELQITEHRKGKKSKTPPTESVEPTPEPGKEITPEAAPAVDTTPRIRKFYMLAALAVQNSTLDQKDDTGLESGHFSTTTIPTWNLLLGYQINEKWATEISYNNQSGKIKSPPDLILNKSNYEWTQVKLEALYNLKPQIDGLAADLAFGLAQERTPFLAGSALSDVDVLTPEFIEIVGGANTSYPIANDIFLLTNGRLAVPLKSSINTGTFTSKTGYKISAEMFGSYQINQYFHLHAGPSFSYFQNSYDYSSNDGLIIRSGKSNLQNVSLAAGLKYWF